MKFYKCEICGNVIAIKENKGHLACCGKDMQLLKPNTTDAAQEKHVPFITPEGAIQIGETLHPATEEHHIVWIYAEGENGGAFEFLNPLEAPIASLKVADCKRIYEYCNLHGLWVLEM